MLLDFYIFSHFVLNVIFNLLKWFLDTYNHVLNVSTVSVCQVVVRDCAVGDRHSGRLAVSQHSTEGPVRPSKWRLPYGAPGKLQQQSVRRQSCIEMVFYSYVSFPYPADTDWQRESIY